MKPFSVSEKHRECWELLPWLANERLSERDARRVEGHLRECERCRSELALQRRLREAIRAEEAVVLAPQASLQKLMQRIEEDATQDEARSCERGRAILPAERTSHFSRVPRWIAIAAGVQAVLIAVLLATTLRQSQELLTAPLFSTLTTPSSVPQGPVIRIVFNDRITLSELNELLRSIDAHIVAGPSKAGVYTVNVAAEHRSNEQVERIAAELRSDSRVLFSEPAIAEITGK
jgi:hypothetical protein